MGSTLERGFADKTTGVRRLVAAVFQVREMGVFIALLVLVGLMSLASPYFLRPLIDCRP